MICTNVIVAISHILFRQCSFKYDYIQYMIKKSRLMLNDFIAILKSITRGCRTERILLQAYLVNLKRTLQNYFVVTNSRWGSQKMTMWNL